MKKGLILGSFDPFHKGHEELIKFGKNNCDLLIVLVCYHKDDHILGKIRHKYMSEKYKDEHCIKIKHTDVDLPNSSEYEVEATRLWSNYLKNEFPEVSIIFTSEEYGEHVAKNMGIEHMSYDTQRNIIPISSTLIRENPFKYWDYISDSMKHFFVKKICICGTESTGKSVLTKKLSEYFDTNYVPEWGAKFVSNSLNVTKCDIMNIGKAHAMDILEKTLTSNKILFSDTDLNTTKMYSKFFFDEIPQYEDWIEEANIFDFYIFLENDSPYIQDGSRLPKDKRDLLRDYHFNYLKQKNLNLVVVDGIDWDDRTDKVIKIVENNFFIN